jgi:D-tyrosyl-tRNA(Tyr) deacylase
VDQQVVGQIDQGLLLFLGVQKNDTQQQADKLLQKIINYRVFSDADAKMNLSLLDITGGLLIVSQFTLVADTKKGLRPGFSSAAEPTVARDLYDYFVSQAGKLSMSDKVQTGVFAADMQVSLVNDGPVTFLLES